MNDTTKRALLDAKYARIIQAMSEMHSLPLNEAMDIFYTSDTAQLIEEGVADLHCRSDRYLAEEIWREYKGNDTPSNL